MGRTAVAAGVAGVGERARGVLERLWRDRRIGLAAAVVVAGSSGLATGLAMPRGPVTTTQALVLIACGLAVGLVAGALSRSPWAMPVAPVAHVAVFELVRHGAGGATVGGIHLGGTYGALAFLVGRGFYGVAALGPMLVGVAYGAALARRARAPVARGHRMLVVRRVVMAATTLALIGLVALIARPAGAPPVRDAAGAIVPGSVASLEKVRIGGVDQWIEIRAWNPDAPVLLSIPGGPGQSDLALSRPTLGELAEDFVVVAWDQRGIGKS